MGGFFPINPGGGAGGGQNPDTAFISVQLRGNELVFTRQNGAQVPVGLDTIIPNALDNLVENIILNDKTLVLEKFDGSTVDVDLTPVLAASNISFNNANSGLTSDNVQGAIDELNGKFIEDITFDTTIDPQTNKPKNTLNKTKNGQLEEVIDHVVTEWKDLEHVSSYNYANYLDYSSLENGKYYEITGIVGQPPTIGSNTAWSLVNVAVNEDSDYTILRKANQSGRIVYLDLDGNFVRGEEVQYQYVNSWWRANISIPQGSGIAFVGLSFQHGSTNASQIMVVEGQVTEALEPIPYLHGYKISIDGDEVGIRFDPTNTTLIGSVVEDLKELDSKVTTINTSTVKTINDQTPDTQGNIRLELENTQDVINFNVEGHTINSITYATQVEVDNLKASIII